MKVKDIMKKVIGVFFEIEEPIKTRAKVPFADNPKVDYKGCFSWEQAMTLEELLEQKTFIKQVWIYEG